MSALPHPSVEPDPSRDARPVEYRARVVTDLDALEPAWRDLATAAAAPNPFFEPWMLRPALAHLRDRGEDVDVVAVEAMDTARPHLPRVLCGLAPFVRQRRWRGLPIEARVLWSFRHCYLGTPLVRAGHVRPALEALLDWSAGAAPLLELRGIAGAGDVRDRLVDLINERDLEATVSGRHTRAALYPAASADAYLSRALSGGKRKELRRQERRLEELGALAYVEETAVEEFIALEARGWKGRAGQALACTDGDRRFFDAICRAAATDGRLLMTTLRAADRVVAAKCSFTAGRGAFAFKIAYDEDYARFSPGVLLEVDNVRRVHARRDIAWMDSCATPDHPMINHLWPDRIPIETVLVAPAAGARASAIVAGAPLLRRATHGVRRLFAGRPSS